MLSAKILVNLWLLGFAVAFVLQTFMQKNLSSRTIWGYAPGWQREIAFWNVGIITAILLARDAMPRANEIILPALALLSLLLGTNHLIAALKNRNMMAHWAGVAGNYLGVVLFIAYKFL